MLALARRDGCQTAALAAHFGETLQQPCGHCAWCRHGKIELPERRTPELTDALGPQVRTLLQTSGGALAHPRSLARFLCGIPSPRLSRTRLGGHPLAGCLAEVPFAQVLGWAEEVAGSG